MKRMLSLLGAVVLGLSLTAATYPSANETSTEPGVWTRNFSGVIEAARTTGYPIFLMVVDSSSCGHCHHMVETTVESAEFKAMEAELTFYKVIMDAPYSSGSADWRTVTSGEYYDHFDYGMYPLVAVVRKDGGIYHAYGNSVTDTRNVADDVRSWIETLSAEQLTGYVPPPSSGTPGAPAAPSVSPIADAGAMKGKYNGIAFDSSLNVVGSFTAAMNGKGRTTIKAVMGSGKWTRKGQLSTNAAGVAAVVADGLELAYDAATGVWSGSEGGLFYAACRAGGNGLAGLYTAALMSGSSAQGGVSIDIKGGKAKVSGIVNGRNKVKSSGVCVSLPAAFVAANLPAWSTGGDVLFAPTVKAGSVEGGFVVANGRVQGRVVVGGIGYTMQGASWQEGTSIGTLTQLQVGSQVDGLTAANEKRLVGASDSSIKITVKSKKGTFKGKSTVGGAKVTVEGVLVNQADGVVGFGTSYGAGVYSVRMSR